MFVKISNRLLETDTCGEDIILDTLEVCMGLLIIINELIMYLIFVYLLVKMFYKFFNSIGGVVLSVLISSVVDGGFESVSGQTNNYKIGICCLSARLVALRSKSKDWLAQNQNNVSGWSDMSIHRSLFQ